ncbi:hypothetical protein VB735_27930 [Halotia wernerae UHCC 0503]|nr:hypothetical protein [Halotia wernerae UHCC 0503]
MPTSSYSVLSPYIAADLRVDLDKQGILNFPISTSSPAINLPHAISVKLASS